MIRIYISPAEQKKLHDTAYELLFSALREDGITASHADILISERGKPYFGDLPVFFGISHCKGYAMCMISDSNIGADCETVRKYHERTALRAFTESENRLIDESGSRDEALSRLWSLKESYVKYTGTGLAGHMHDIVFDRIPRYGEMIELCGTKLVQFLYEGVIISVCCDNLDSVILNSKAIIPPPEQF